MNFRIVHYFVGSGNLIAQPLACLPVWPPYRIHIYFVAFVDEEAGCGSHLILDVRFILAVNPVIRGAPIDADPPFAGLLAIRIRRLAGTIAWPDRRSP